MPFCPSCNQQSRDPGAVFCSHCGFALPDGRDDAALEALGSEPSAAAGEAPCAERPRRPGWAADANPGAVAVGLGALLAAVLLAIALSFGSTRPRRLVPEPAPKRPGARSSATAGAGPPARLPAPFHHLGMADARPPISHVVQMSRYRAAGYSFAYPRGWRIAADDRALASYRETVVRSADGGATVNVDYSPGQTADPTAKASEVEAPTSSTPGYRRISYGPTTVGGRAAFAWDFVVADADPRRADLFISVPGGDFALLAHGPDFARARSAARLIAGSLDASAAPHV